MKRILCAVILLSAGLLACESHGPIADSLADPEPALRLYVFDCGRIGFEDVSNFGLSNDETPVRELFVPCYLIEHPAGRLLWDGGLPLAMAGQGEITPEEGVSLRYERSLVDQLADMGLAPADIGRVAFSHMHFDHVGAANLFPDATLLIQRAEHEAAFGDKPRSFFDPTLYAALQDAKTLLLDGDHDVFGDGRVQILSAPGHTPGHQVLLLELAEFGPLILSGDLYHFRASRRLRRTPDFNSDSVATLRSMDRIEQIVAQRNATFWIEHDLALAKTLKLAPAWVE